MMDLDLLSVMLRRCGRRPLGGHASGEKVKSFGREFYSFSSLFLLAATVFRNRAQEGGKGRGWRDERRCLPVSFVVEHSIKND